MLVVSRKEGEFIFIRTPEGDTIEICLVKVRTDAARIGITADRKFEIVRDNAKCQKSNRPTCS